MVTDEMRAEVVRIPGWERFGWLRHGFSTRSYGASSAYGQGELNLGLTKDDDPENVLLNRRLLVEAVAGGGKGPRLVTVRQVHGVEIRSVGADESPVGGRPLTEADGLMTADPGLMLGIQVADCVPVLVADVRRKVVAGFHAGWRGTAAGIVELGISRMREEFGSQPEDLVGAVGPSIGGCCYTVGDEVRGEFERRFPYTAALFDEREDGMHLDLAEANRRQIAGAGLRAETIAVVGECTACTRLADGRRKYFSHRAEQGFTGRGMGVIGVAG